MLLNLNLFALVSIVHLLCLLPAVGAPSREKGPDGEKHGRLAWFIQTSIPEDVENPVKVMLGNDIQLVTLSNRVASAPVEIPDNGVLRLVKEIPDPRGKGKVTYVTLAKAVVPKEVNKALVIMTPVAHRPGRGIRFLTRVQALDRFNGGDFMYINLTNAIIRIEIGDDKIQMKPGALKIHRVAKAKKLVSVPYRYSFYHAKKRRWMPLNGSMAISSVTRREVLIFTVNPQTGRIRSKGITFPVEIER